MPFSPKIHASCLASSRRIAVSRLHRARASFKDSGPNVCHLILSLLPFLALKLVVMNEEGRTSWRSSQQELVQMPGMPGTFNGALFHLSCNQPGHSDFFVSTDTLRGLGCPECRVRESLSHAPDSRLIHRRLRSMCRRLVFLIPTRSMRTSLRKLSPLHSSVMLNNEACA